MKQIRVVGAALCAALVAFSSAVQAAVDKGKFAASVTFTASGYSGGETLANFPMLVKLSESIKDFKYSDCPQTSIRFADADGNLIPHEVDVWDASGASFIWVSVPALSGTTTSVKMYYGGDGADEPASTDNVWTLANFKSVWHLNIADGATSDSVASYAGTLLNPNTYCGAGTGIVGGDYLNVENLVNHSIKVTNMSAFTANPAGVVTYSAWVRQVGGSSISTKPDPDNYPQIQWGSWGNCGAIWNSKNAQTSGNQGIELCLEGGKTNPQQFQRMVLRDSANTGANLNSALPNGLYDKQWHYVVVRYNGTNRQLIIDGVSQSNFSSAGTVTTPKGIVRMGGRVDTNADCVWTGDLDEMRYRQGCTSDDWLKAETANVGSYDTFVTAVQEPMDETKIKFESAPTATKSANGFTVSVKVTGGAGSLSVIYGTEYPYANTNQVAASVSVGETYSLELTGLTADRCYGFGVVGVGTSGVVTENLGEGGFLTGEIGIAKTSDADESHLNTPGVFTVTRPSTATADDMVVKYAVSGTAVAGTHYVALPGTVTIPAGAASATVEVYPLASYTGEHSLTLTLSEGPYGIGAGAATMAIRSFTAESGFAKKIVLTASGYAGATTLANFPLLVRLSPSINGFSYADFQLANGGDLRFATEDGVPLVHEIDTWNPEGESLVWVKVPALAKDTQIVAYYGNVDPWAVTAADVWNGYVGVWHFNVITDGTTPDATGNNLGMVAKTASVQVAAEGGQIGRSIVNCTSSGGTNGGFLSPTYTDKFSSNKFTVSAWFNRNGKAMNGYERYFSSKAVHSDTNGFEMEDKSGSATELTARGSAGDSVTVKVPNQSKAGWNKITLVYDGSKLTAYTNGAPSAVNQTVTTVVHSKGFAVGNNAARNERALLGNIDEVRFAKSCESADWVKAEYDTEAKAGFLTTENGVEPVDATAVKFAAKPTITKTGSTFKVGVSTASDSGEGSIAAVYTADGETVLSDLMTSAAVASSDYEVALTQLAADTSYRAAVRGENAKGTVTKANADNALYNGIPAVVKTRDADEAALSTPGLFTISRADTYGDLVINYTTGGDAVAGTDYEELPGTITIPDGQSAATIEVRPIKTKTSDHTLTLTLADGLYLLGATPPTATMTIKTLVTPTGYNTWIADADGDASVAANWSEGRVPLTTDNILVDGRFSTASMTWEAGVNGLPSTVASWTQSYVPGDTEYTGTVTFKTVYPGKGDFTCFTVVGACVIQSGTWTHPQSRTMGDKHDSSWDWLADLKANETYRLRLSCDSLSVGAKGKIDVAAKGYYASHNDSRLMYTAHGGVMSSTGMAAYDDPKEPIHIGLPHRAAASYWTGRGGGAIYIVVANGATVNGLVSADSGNVASGSGAAGSVYINAKTLTGSGSITARGSGSGDANYKGAGGRIAIITETPVNRATFSEISAESEWAHSGTTHATYYGGAGTVFFKDSTMTNGKLVIAPKSDFPLNWTNRDRMTAVGIDGDWTFDSIEFGRNGFLVIPNGRTLHLPGGLASCSGTATATSVYGGLRAEGGTLDLGSAANQTMSGNWMIFANSNLTLNANVTVTDGAVIGVPEYGNISEDGATLPAFPACKVTVNGNLTVDTTGKLKAEKCGFRKSWNNTEKGLTGYDTHGGRTMAFGKTLKLHYLGYDSIFNPWLPGCTVPHTNGQGVGNTASVLDFTVTGTLTANGPISATATYEGAATHNSGAGPGGSINITAGELAGSGNISADGACNSGNACGGGGRIAVRLTNPGATFAGFSGSIIASGRLSSADKLNNSSSAGTVYLQTAAEGEKYGTIRIANRMVDKYYHAANSNTTEMASLGYGGDEVVDYKHAKYVVADYGRAAVNTNMQAASVFLADTTAHLDLEGNALKVKSFKYVTKDGDVVTTNKLSNGTYTFAELSGIANLNVDDSSEGDTGSITVTGGGMAIIIR